jgi:lipoprotein-anchoring transpeptidase ErfK/SrfK
MKSHLFLAKPTVFLIGAGAALWIGAAAAAPLPVPGHTGELFGSTAAERPVINTPDADPFELAPNLRRQVVDYSRKVAPGTVIIDTAQTYLYYVLGDGRAIRYGIGVGREGFTWSGTESVTRKAEWPDWTPPAEMIARQPYLARFTAGGEGNPLGARAIYLGNTMYRIHGTNNPETIGQNVSSGCIRLLNADVIDLYSRVSVGTKVIVLPNHGSVAMIAAPTVPAHFAVPQIHDPSASNIY